MIFASVTVYCLARELGREDSQAEFRRQVAEPTPESLPSARTMARLATVEELALAVDAGSTALSKSRSRMLHAFHSTPAADVWVSCDDDVEASLETVRWLVEAVRETRGCCIAPCMLRRREPICNIMFESAGVLRPLSGGGQVVRCLGGGFGLVAVHRDVVDRIYAERDDLAWIDEDGQEKRAAFHEWIDPVNRRWWGEDLSFFIRGLPPGVPVDCLVSGHTVHDGRLLDLAQVPSQARISLPPGASLTPDGQVLCKSCGTRQPTPKIIPARCAMCAGEL